MEPPFYQLLFSELTRGLGLSLSIIIPSAVLGVIIGVLVGTVRGTGYPRFLVKPLQAYVSLFRGTALVVQLFIVYYGLPNLAIWLKPIFDAHGWPAVYQILYLSPYTASVLVFSLCSGAYQSEYIRGAILSIKRGQFLAARALGFSQRQNFFAIVIPQAIRRAWPGCGNEIIYLIKYSSLAYIITARELTGTAISLSDTFFRPMEVYFAAGLYYLFLVTLATWLLHCAEKSFTIPGFGRA